MLAYIYMYIVYSFQLVIHSNAGIYMYILYSFQLVIHSNAGIYIYMYIVYSFQLACKNVHQRSRNLNLPFRTIFQYAIAMSRSVRAR